jgi:hypothetical protein
VKWIVVIVVVVVVLLAILAVASVGVWLVVRDDADGGGQTSGVDTSSSEAPYIYVEVEEITPEVRAAVPATYDGYRVVLRKEVPPTSPPLLAGEVKSLRAATTERAAAGLAGSLVVDGDFYSKRYGFEDSTPRTLTVRVPAAVQVWRPMGEGKEFIAFGDIRPGDEVRVTLTERLAKGARSATAADVEVY